PDSLPAALDVGLMPLAGFGYTSRGRSRAMNGGPGIKIGRILGIPIYLHASWFIIFALITFSLAKQFAYQHSHWTDAQHWAAGLITSLLFFGSVLFHELAHSVVACATASRWFRSRCLFSAVWRALDASPPAPNRSSISPSPGHSPATCWQAASGC